MPMSTRVERRERMHAKYAPARTKALYLIAFFILYLAIIWSFIKLVELRTTNGLIPAMGATLILLVLMLHNSEWRSGTERRGLFAAIVILLFAGLGAHMVFGSALDLGYLLMLLGIFIIVAAGLFLGLFALGKHGAAKALAHAAGGHGEHSGPLGKAFPIFLIIFFAALAFTVTGVQGVAGVPFLILLIIALLVLFVLVTGVLVFFMDLVFWEGN